MEARERIEHPKTRFQRYVWDNWGMEVAQLDQEDRDIAIADWQVQEMSICLGNGPRGRGDRSIYKVVDVAVRGGPWALIAAMFFWIINRIS